MRTTHFIGRERSVLANEALRLVLLHFDLSAEIFGSGNTQIENQILHRADVCGLETGQSKYVTFEGLIVSGKVIRAVGCKYRNTCTFVEKQRITRRCRN